MIYNNDMYFCILYTCRSPADMIHTTAATQEIFTHNYDVHGDSYSNAISEDHLRDIFTQMVRFICRFYYSIKNLLKVYSH